MNFSFGSYIILQSQDFSYLKSKNNNICLVSLLGGLRQKMQEESSA
jgi:hypothetical protein